MALLHVIALLLTIPFILYADWMGSRWMRGVVDVLPERKVQLAHTAVSYGLISLLLTGGIMFIDRWQYLLSQPAFLAKIVLVLALVINGFFIGKLSQLATRSSFAALSPSEKRAVLISGGVSSVSWVSAILLGLYIGGGWS